MSWGAREQARRGAQRISRGDEPQPLPSARIVAVDTVARAYGEIIHRLGGALNPAAKIGVGRRGGLVIFPERVSVKQGWQSGLSAAQRGKVARSAGWGRPQ